MRRCCQSYAFALTPYRLAQSDHLQVLMNGWMPIGLLGLHRYFASGSRGWLLVFAAAYLLTGLSNGYYLYFFLLPIGVVVGMAACSGRGCRGGASSATSQSPQWGSRAVLAPIVFVYFRLQQQMRFTRDPRPAGGLQRRAVGLLQSCRRGLELGRPPAGRPRRAASVSWFRCHDLRGRGRMHGCGSQSRPGIGRQPASHRDHIRLDRRARCVALNGARTLAT